MNADRHFVQHYASRMSENNSKSFESNTLMRFKELVRTEETYNATWNWHVLIPLSERCCGSGVVW